MAYNRCPVRLKQFCHLSLSQPHRIVFQADIYLRLPVFRLIYCYLVFFHKSRFIGFVTDAKVRLILARRSHFHELILFITNFFVYLRKNKIIIIGFFCKLIGHLIMSGVSGKSPSPITHYNY